MDQLAARGSQAARQWRLDVQVLVRAQQLVYFVGGAHNSFVCIGVTSLISYYDKNKWANYGNLKFLSIFFVNL